MDNLTNEEVLFCEEYLTSFNLRKAGLATGKVNSSSGAHGLAKRILERPHVREYIKTCVQNRRIATESQREDIEAVLVEIAFSEDSKPAERISAIAQLSKMRGYNELSDDEKQESNAIAVPEKFWTGKRKLTLEIE